MYHPNRGITRDIPQLSNLQKPQLWRENVCKCTPDGFHWEFTINPGPWQNIWKNAAFVRHVSRIWPPDRIQADGRTGESPETFGTNVATEVLAAIWPRPQWLGLRRMSRMIRPSAPPPVRLDACACVRMHAGGPRRSRPRTAWCLRGRGGAGSRRRQWFRLAVCVCVWCVCVRVCACARVRVCVCVCVRVCV